MLLLTSLLIVTVLLLTMSVFAVTVDVAGMAATNMQHSGVLLVCSSRTHNSPQSSECRSGSPCSEITFRSLPPTWAGIQALTFVWASHHSALGAPECTCITRLLGMLCQDCKPCTPGTKVSRCTVRTKAHMADGHMDPPAALDWGMPGASGMASSLSSPL